MHLICEPAGRLAVDRAVDFVAVQDFLCDESACRAVWDLVTGQFRTRGKFLAIWPAVGHVVMHRDPTGAVDGFLLVSELVNWQLDYVVVRDDARGQGIASALVCGALDEACRRTRDNVKAVSQALARRLLSDPTVRADIERRFDTLPGIRSTKFPPGP